MQHDDAARPEPMRELLDAARDFRDCLTAYAWNHVPASRRVELIERYKPDSGTRPMRAAEARFIGALAAVDEAETVAGTPDIGTRCHAFADELRPILDAMQPKATARHGLLQLITALHYVGDDAQQHPEDYRLP